MGNISTKASCVALPATCGELVQGTLDGVPCLVSCPIERYSAAWVRLLPRDLWRVPRSAPKSEAALRAGLAFLADDLEPCGLHLELDTEIPQGRGYGSSTADIGASLYALGEALSRPLTAAQTARLAVRIEPTDSTPFPGLALFDHRLGSRYEELGQAPPLMVIVLDPGDEVDTIAFNRVDHREALRRLASQHAEAFGLLRYGIASGDPGAIGAAATLSAQAHQAILHNPLLEQAALLSRQVGAVGLCRAHSGTILGLLLDPTRADVPAIARFVADRMGPSIDIGCYPLVDGGPRKLVGKEPCEQLLADYH